MNANDTQLLRAICFGLLALCTSSAVFQAIVLVVEVGWVVVVHRFNEGADRTAEVAR